MPSVSLILYGIGALFMMICIGTAVGALSKATTDKTKAKTMGITAFAFCMLACMFFFGGFGMTKVGATNKV